MNPGQKIYSHSTSPYLGCCATTNVHLSYLFLALFKKIKIARSKAAFVANFQVFQLPLKNSSSSWYHNLKICIHAQHASVHKGKLSKCLENIFLECLAPFGAILGHLDPIWAIGRCHRLGCFYKKHADHWAATRVQRKRPRPLRRPPHPSAWLR